MNAETYGLISLLPPLLAIGLALMTRQVFLALFVGIWLGFVILAQGNPLSGTLDMLDGLVAVFNDAGNTRIIIFTLVVGALMALIQRSGGVQGFVDWVLSRLQAAPTEDGREINQGPWGAGRLKVELMALLTGLVLFVESNISILTTGTLYRPVFDRLRIPREKLAYITDSTSAPSCILLPFNAWGAFILGLIAAQGLEQPFKILMQATLFNVYPMLVILVLLTVIVTRWDMGEMKRAEARARDTGQLLRDGAQPMMGGEATQIEAKPGITPKARHMIIPIAAMVLLMPVFLIMTGWSAETDDWLRALQAGSGSKSVLYATSFACLLAAGLYKIGGILRVRDMVDLSLKGMSAMVPLALLMVLAFALGGLCKELGTGPFMAELAQGLIAPALVPVLIFWLSCFIAFSTGTSWGTFAIMIAIAIPVAQGLGVHVSLAIAAALGGGVFGDHCSPTSDTSLISSMATACDHIDHVRTQLPYALLAGALTSCIYLLLGLIMAP